MQEKRPSHDWFVVFVVIALFLIPLYLIPEVPFFKPSIVSEASNYGFVVYVVLLLWFLWWAVEKVRNERSPKNILTTLGFRWSRQQVAVGFIIGCFDGALMWFLEGGNIEKIPPVDLVLVVNMLLGAPLVEEVLFRGYLINRLLHFKKTSQRKILAIVASIFIFSWVHASYPKQKLVGGIAFTSVYLWGWKNNMVAAIAAHLGSNATILLLEYSSRGIIATIGTLGIIAMMVSLLFLILRWIYPITDIVVRIFVKFLQKIPRRKP